ncbi:MAG: hypothetical protein RMK31_00210 [Candidatus Caldarchaeum sp.]|nr:hypothetical protein [Candidatus Caldarchaeum sp.]
MSVEPLAAFVAALAVFSLAVIPAATTQQQEVEWHKPVHFLGAQTVLVLLVEFSDVKMRVSARQVEQMVMAVDEFVRSSSYGKAWLEYQVHPNVITLPKPMSYYGAPKSGAQRGDDNAKITEYHATIIKTAKERERIDISKFKHILVVHAGKNEAVGGSVNNIWSHCLCVAPRILHRLIEEFGFDVVESELRKQGLGWVVDLYMHRGVGGAVHLVAGIETVAEDDSPAVVVHEFMHSMWLPDHYVYREDGYSAGSEVGVWTNMDYGPYLDPPVDVDGWSKHLLGWVKVVEVNKTGEYTIHTLDKPDEPHALIIPINEREYYFLHARRPAGLDAALPAPGVLLFLINKYVQTNVEGKEYFIRLLDANPATPRECVNVRQSAARLCDGFDAPYYSEEGHRGRWTAFGRQWAIDLLKADYTTEEGVYIKVVEFSQADGTTRVLIRLDGVRTTTTTRETAEKPTEHSTEPYEDGYDSVFITLAVLITVLTLISARRPAYRPRFRQ